jgi:hypothetical protein
MLSKISPPETRTTKQDIYVQGLFRIKPTFSVKVAYTFEKYDISDYTAENIDLIEGASAGQSSIFLGDSVHDYKAHIYAVSGQYKFGG